MAKQLDSLVIEVHCDSSGNITNVIENYNVSDGSLKGTVSREISVTETDGLDTICTARTAQVKSDESIS